VRSAEKAERRLFSVARGLVGEGARTEQSASQRSFGFGSEPPGHPRGLAYFRSPVLPSLS